MKKISNIHIYSVMLLIVLLALSGCNRYKDINEKMNLAENLMANKPDSALAILNGIKTSDLNDNEISARFALLKSMALDKNFIDTTTFDVLQPAIDYYLLHGNGDEKLQTLYYQGRIFQNQGDDDAAMRSFMDACDLTEKLTDSLLLAHTFVAQGTLYFKQYKINEFIHNNLKAAELYGVVGRTLLEIKSYTNALDGYTMTNNKAAADSLMSICMTLVQENPEGESYLFPSLLSYTIEFCSPGEIKEFLDEYQDLELTADEAIDFAQGYSKLGEYDKAISLLSEVGPAGTTLDSLKYSSVKIGVLEKQGKYEQALNLYKNYSAMLENYQKDLLSKDLLFSDKKHQLEMKNLMEIQDRDRIIWGTLCGIFGLIILIGWLYYQSYLGRTRRILTERENENLRLEQDNLRKEKEKAELERDKNILEAENLEKDKKRLEAEQRQHELETANLKLEISRLESERDNLKELQREQSELARPIQDVIKSRIDMLSNR